MKRNSSLILMTLTVALATLPTLAQVCPTDAIILAE